MTKLEWIDFLKSKDINTDLYDFKVKNSNRYGNEIWCYRKSDTGYSKKVTTGFVLVDGERYKYRSKEYFERCQKQYSEIAREYKQVSHRVGIVIVEQDLPEISDEDIKYYFV